MRLIRNQVGSLWRLNVGLRRLTIVTLSVGMTAAACAWAKWLPLQHPIEVIAAGILALLVFGGSFNFCLHIFGFLLDWARTGDKQGRYLTPVEAEDEITEVAARTAVVMPIYNEDVERVFQGVRQTWLGIQRAGLTRDCDFYLLSDSTDEQIKQGEEEIYRRLLGEFQIEADSFPPGQTPGRGPVPSNDAANRNGNELHLGRIFLLRRKERAKYKAGNIANFLVHHGGAYDFMLVLDADSVMLARTIKRLILRMQAQENLAVLQTIVFPIRAMTPLARAFQFSAWRTLPLFALGQYWFYGCDSVYWATTL